MPPTLAPPPTQTPKTHPTEAATPGPTQDRKRPRGRCGQGHRARPGSHAGSGSNRTVESAGGSAPQGGKRDPGRCSEAHRTARGSRWVRIQSRRGGRRARPAGNDESGSRKGAASRTAREGAAKRTEQAWRSRWVRTQPQRRAGARLPARTDAATGRVQRGAREGGAKRTEQPRRFTLGQNSTARRRGPAPGKDESRPRKVQPSTPTGKVQRSRTDGKGAAKAPNRDETTLGQKPTAPWGLGGLDPPASTEAGPREGAAEHTDGKGAAKAPNRDETTLGQKPTAPWGLGGLGPPASTEAGPREGAAKRTEQGRRTGGPPGVPGGPFSPVPTGDSTMEGGDGECQLCAPIVSTVHHRRSEVLPTVMRRRGRTSVGRPR